MSIAFTDMKSGALTKLDTQLSALYYANTSQAVAMEAFTTSVQHFSGALSPDGQFVVIDATAADGNGAALLAQLEAIGLQNGASFGSVASGVIAVSAVPDLLNVADLAHAQESAMTVNTGSVDTQADQAQHADTARASFGFDGTGVRVGVISDSFNNLGGASAGVASGDLPTVHVIQDSGTTDEGRAMAELVHDLAPGAAISFATANGGQANFANNILALAADGAKVIVDDVQYFAEPAYQDGVIAQAVNQVTAQGVAYFSSAGNQGLQGYEGVWNGGPAKTIGTTQGGPITESFMQFAPGQDYLTLDLQFVDTIVLQWDRPANSASGPSPGPGDDLDLFITNAAGDRIFEADTAINSTGDPIAIVSISSLAANQTTGTNYLRVGFFNNGGETPPTEIKVISFKNTLGNNIASNLNNGTVYGHAAASGATGVAASAFFDTPAFGTTPPLVESFSSGGPVTKWYDVNGNRLATPQVVGSPQITGVDGGNTTFFGSDSSHDPDGLPNFFGTSAAAPDVAAVAALLLQENPSLTPAQILNILQSTAIDMGTPGYDSRTGSGLVDAFAAVQSILPVAPTPTTAPTDFNADGNSDMLWRNTGNGFVSEWQMANAKLQNNLGVDQLNGTWHFQDTGDFGNDGKSDILWRNDSGQVVLWTMDGNHITGNQNVGTLNAQYHNQGVADFNADGKADVLWRHDSGQVSLWTMDGNQIVGNQNVGVIASNLHIQGLLDANGDHKSDVLLRDSNSGQVVLWTMDGAQIVGNQAVSNNLGLNWHILGTGDFNADGKDDILLREGNTGQVALWTMNGNQITANQNVGVIASNWQFQDAGDYNHDGKSDVIWRDAGSGQVVMWEMNGATITANHEVMMSNNQPAKIGLDWQFQVHHFDLV